jgi:CubicO group peptidase (beta-lactamase class C family)
MRDTGATDDTVHGIWDARFAPLVEAFSGSVAGGTERGAIAVAVDGRMAVHAWGGLADAETGRTWNADTLACCFSVTKGVLSLLAHRLVDTGRLDLDRPVADYWPQFGVAGKARITVLDLLTHRAGLPAVTGAVRQGSLYDWDTMTALLAASAPVVAARSHPVYHNMTYGHLIGETMVRATGATSLTALLDQELTGPLGVDFGLGLTPGQADRAARLTQDNGMHPMLGIDPACEDLFQKSMRFFSLEEDFNTPAWRGASIGSGSGHATAHALAILFGQLVWRDALLSPERQIAARTLSAESDGLDPVMGIPIRYGQGFELSLPPKLDFGPNPETVGHWGAGGSIAFADPATGLSFGYVTGTMAPGAGSSDRSRRLVAALYDCL